MEFFLSNHTFVYVAKVAMKVAKSLGKLIPKN